MQWIVDVMGGMVQRRAGVVLSVLALLTVGFAGLTTQLRVETDITEFAGEAPLATAFERIDEQFGLRGGGLQVIVDAGRGGNVLSSEGLEVARDIEATAEATIPGALPDDTPGRPAVISYASPLLAGVAEIDLDADELSPPFVGALLDRVLDQQGDEVRSLLSDDLDVDAARARGGLVSIQLAPGLDQQQRREAGTMLRHRLEEEAHGFFSVEPFSVELLEDELEEGLFVELPLLLGVSLLLIVALLWLLFRSVVDVVIALVGLLMVQVWLAGLAALLGPEVLGIIGPFNQIAVAVPVMLIGLGVDYSVHLTARIREERVGGAAAEVAAGRAVRTVGVALLLVTLTTMVGFLSNVQSPLPPIADFGVIVAAGMLAAFVVMGLLVPSARQLVDQRRTLPTREPGGGEGGISDRVLRAAAGLACRFPVGVVVVGVVLGVLGTVAALDLDTEFAQEDFIPEGTRADRVLTTMEELFGGDVTEETFLLVEGDLTDPAVVAAFERVEERVLEVDGVQTIDGAAEIVTPRSIVAQLEEAGRQLQQQLVDQARVVVGELPVTELLPLPDEVAADELPDTLGDELDELDELDEGDGGLGASGDLDPGDVLDTEGGFGELEGEFGDGLAPLDPEFGRRLEDRLPPGVSSEEALTGLLGGQQLAELLEEQAEEELRDELRAMLGADTARRLASVDPQQVDRELLEDVGYPVDQLGDAALDLVALVGDLRELGWQDARLGPDADPDAVFERVEREAGDDLALVLAADRGLALAIVPTQAGEDGAEALAEGLLAAAEPLAQVGAEVMAVSEQLVVEETLDLLVDAQVEKILFSLGAALALLIVFYLLSQRRPVLGVITMVPTLLAVPIVLGSMWVLGLPFNALTATIASVAIGFGVDYGIHLSNRFREERESAATPQDAVRETVAHTGAALAGSAATTIAAFGVLMLSDLTPVAQFGAITAMTMLAALVTTVLAQSSCLLLWERHHRRRAPSRAASAHADAGGQLNSSISSATESTIRDGR